VKKAPALLAPLLVAGGAVAGYPALRHLLAERDYRAQVRAAAGRGEFGLIADIWERHRGRLGEPWTDCVPPRGGLRADDPELLLSTRAYARVLTVLEPSGLLPTGRPTFRWLAPPGERRYQVTVMSRTVHGPVLDRETTATELPFPPEVAALQPGFEYLVTVRDLENVLTPGNAGIKIAWADKAKGTDEALRLLQERLGEGPAFEFFAGNLLLRPRDDARSFPCAAAKHFEALVQRFPNSRLLHELLARIYARLAVGPLVQRELEALRRIDAGG
jgi:hypothetical protein